MGSTAIRIIALLRLLERTSNETDSEYLLRIATFTWEGVQAHFSSEKVSMRDGKQRHIIDHLPTGCIGWHSCIEELFLNLDTTANREGVDLKRIAQILHDTIRDWNIHPDSCLHMK